jgi:hypothetical protein
MMGVVLAAGIPQTIQAHQIGIAVDLFSQLNWGKGKARWAKGAEIQTPIVEKATNSLPARKTLSAGGTVAS